MTSNFNNLISSPVVPEQKKVGDGKQPKFLIKQDQLSKLLQKALEKKNDKSTIVTAVSIFDFNREITSKSQLEEEPIKNNVPKQHKKYQKTQDFSKEEDCKKELSR